MSRLRRAVETATRSPAVAAASVDNLSQPSTVLAEPLPGQEYSSEDVSSPDDSSSSDAVSSWSDGTPSVEVVAVSFPVALYADAESASQDDVNDAGIP